MSNTMKKPLLLITAIYFAGGPLGFCQDPVILTVTQSSPLLANAGTDVRINKGESVTIGGNPSASQGYGEYIYLWSPAEGLDDPTQANPSASPGATTTYLLTITDAQNCTSADEVTISVDASGVEDLASVLEIRCYPNPVGDELIIEMKGIISDPIVRLVSMLGKELIIRTSHPAGFSTIERIPMQDLPAGVYYLQVISAETTISRPILKNRQP